MINNLRFALLLISLAFVSGAAWSAGRETRWARRRAADEKYVIQWFDATANFERLSSRQGVRRILDKCVEVGIDAVAVGLRPLSGHTMYPGCHAPQLLEWKGFRYPAGYDLMATVLEEAHKRDLDVHALLMFVSQGHKSFSIGPVYGKHPEWAGVVYDIDVGAGETEARLHDIRTLKRGVLTGSIWAAFTDPGDPRIQARDLAVLIEVLERYPKIDGLVIDRVRYNGLNADFGPGSRRRFEAWLGRAVEQWPEDVFTLTLGEAGKPHITAGPLFKDWCRFRALTIRRYIERIRAAIDEYHPGLVFGDYVGAWYPDYYRYGVNWASERYVPDEREMSEWAGRFWSPGYERTGYAELMDYLAVGCYFPYLVRADAERAGAPWWQSVEGGTQIAREAVKGACPILPAIYLQDWRGNAEGFVKALRLGLELGDGIKIFDLSQVEDYEWWPQIAEALGRCKPAYAPEQ